MSFDKSYGKKIGMRALSKRFHISTFGAILIQWAQKMPQKLERFEIPTYILSNSDPVIIFIQIFGAFFVPKKSY